MNRLFKAGFAGVVAITLTATVTASGPKWTELGDAGSTPGGAQTPAGIGSLAFINGSLGSVSLAGAFDFEDMFMINIVDPFNFRATTEPNDPELVDAFANFNSQLWLFQPAAPGDLLNALGYLGNDDHPDVAQSVRSLLIPMTSDGFPDLVDPGIYFIAITRFNNDPVSAIGEIFDQVSLTEISGPDGDGGAFPITGWTGDKDGFDGGYRIALQGVEFVPAPGTIILFGLAALRRRRRRRMPSD